LGGRPIVETVQDAVEAFAAMPINVLALGRFVVVKNLSPELAVSGVLPLTYSIPTTLVRGARREKLDVEGGLSRRVIRRVQEDTEAVVFVRHDFPLYGPYLEWLRAGRKVTTIRYRRRGVEVPRDAVLPLFETADYGVGARERPAAQVRVKSIRYQRFGELSRDDAVNDGFESLDHMLDDFCKIYPKLREEDWVTVYGIALVERDGTANGFEAAKRASA
jgi:ASC-1-like (ASCH) protein